MADALRPLLDEDIELVLPRTATLSDGARENLERALEVSAPLGRARLPERSVFAFGSAAEERAVSQARNSIHLDDITGERTA